jgi:hypothetical protein
VVSNGMHATFTLASGVRLSDGGSSGGTDRCVGRVSGSVCGRVSGANCFHPIHGRALAMKSSPIWLMMVRATSTPVKADVQLLRPAVAR